VLSDNVQDPRMRRRAVVLAAGTLAVATLSTVTPIPNVVAPRPRAMAASTATALSANTMTATSQGAIPSAITTLPATSPAHLAITPVPTAQHRRAAATPVARTTPTALAPFRVGTAQYAQWHARRIMATRYGWTSQAQFTCLVNLWDRESHWNFKAHNRSSGAHGIPQAMPGSKMGQVSTDWRSNPVTQIRWGLGYIKGRYGNPCNAWRHFTSHNWY
jgi:hypothetical protein